MQLTKPRLRFGRKRWKLATGMTVLAAIAAIGVAWFMVFQPELGGSPPPESPEAVTSDPSSAYHDDQAEDSHSERIPPAAGSPTLVIDIEITDFQIKPNPIVVDTETTVRFRVVNTGTVLHEFRLANGHDVEEHLISDSLPDATVNHPESGSMIAILVDPNERREIDVDFTADTGIYTVAVCLIRGHYEAGMWATLQYENPG